MSDCPEWLTAWSTFALFIATAALWIFTALLWWAAHNEFIATHRPRLRIRNFSARNFGQMVSALQFNIFNIGDSVAKEIRISYAYLWTEDISDVISLFENSSRNLSIDTPIEPGDISTQSVVDHEWEKKNIPNEGIHYRSGRRFFIIGRAIYKDRLGVERNTGFLREAEISETQEQGATIKRIRGFKKASDSDYEYED